MTGVTDIIECLQCGRMFNNTDGTFVCPNGHENPWAETDSSYNDQLQRRTC